MNRLDALVFRQSIHPDAQRKLEDLQVFAEIDSTNTYLMQGPAPAPGMFRVVAADCQTAGRGRRQRQWVSPPGAGLYLSFAYTFQAFPRGLPALTLALGISVIDALNDLGFSGVSLKWPNDLVLRDAKLGGILTELQHEGSSNLTVVVGIGMNIDLPDSLEVGEDSEWAKRATDLASTTQVIPDCEVLAAGIVDELTQACLEFEIHGFARFVQRWPSIDWLLGKDIVVDNDVDKIHGMAAGVDSDGALLVQNDEGERRRVISGSIALVAKGEDTA